MCEDKAVSDDLQLVKWTEVFQGGVVHIYRMKIASRKQTQSQARL